jgi:hypothetical protein
MNVSKVMLKAAALICLSIVLTLSSASSQISQIQVSNLTSTSATITWYTPDSSDGCVVYGLATDALDDTACDTRPDDDIHCVEITGLSANTVYYFEVVSGGTTDNNKGASYSFTTADVGNGVPYMIFGWVMLSDGVTPARGTIVIVQLKSNGSLSYPLSRLTYPNGVWSLNLGNLKNPVDGTVLAYNTGDTILVHAQGAADGVGQVITTVSGTNPQKIETMVLGKTNQAPALDPVGTQEVSVGDTLGFRVCAADPDGDPVALTAENVPANASFIDSGNGSGSFTFSPIYSQCGIYDVTFIASDGDLTDSELVQITVNSEVISVVQLDIKPQSCPNPFNTKAKGVLPVAILGTEDFDVMTVDPATALLEGVAPLRWNLEDVSAPVDLKEDSCTCATNAADGYVDLTLKFDRQEIFATLQPVSDGEQRVLTLTGITYTGTELKGEDCVLIIHKGSSRLPGETVNKLSLKNSYPNPFNTRTTIEYVLPEDCHVKVTVYNVLGREVRLLVNGYQFEGQTTVVWDAKDNAGHEAASGIYFYTIQAGDNVETKKVLLLK